MPTDISAIKRNFCCVFWEQSQCAINHTDVIPKYCVVWTKVQCFDTLSILTCFPGKADPCVSVCVDKHLRLGFPGLGKEWSEATILRYSGLPGSRNASTPYPPTVQKRKKRVWTYNYKRKNYGAVGIWTRNILLGRCRGRLRDPKFFAELSLVLLIPIFTLTVSKSILLAARRTFLVF